MLIYTLVEFSFFEEIVVDKRIDLSFAESEKTWEF